MSGFLGRARVATVVAAALALLATGVVAGAAGQAPPGHQESTGAGVADGLVAVEEEEKRLQPGGVPGGAQGAQNGCVKFDQRFEA